MKRLAPYVVLPFVIIALSAATAHAADSCKFDPKNITISDVVTLYSCVPIADALCATMCGKDAASSAINTDIVNGHLGNTTLECSSPITKVKTEHKAAVTGLAQPLNVQCAPPVAHL